MLSGAFDTSLGHCNGSVGDACGRFLCEFRDAV